MEVLASHKGNRGAGSLAFPPGLQQARHWGGGQSAANPGPRVNQCWRRWMLAIRVVCNGSLDIPLDPQLYKPNRLWALGRVMGESPGSHGILLGAPPAFAGHFHISHSYRLCLGNRAPPAVGGCD